MSAIVAIDISDRLATLVAAQRGENDSIDLLRVRTVPIDEVSLLPPLEEELHETTSPEEETEEVPEAEESDSEFQSPSLKINPKQIDPQRLEEILGIEVEGSIGVLPGSEVLYRVFKLPFGNQKKIDQIAPLELEDGLPFELDEFVFDNQILRRDESGQYEVLSSLIPSERVAEGLYTFAQLGSDPKTLTTKASALLGIAEHVASKEHECFALIEVSSGRASLAVFEDGVARRYRDLPLIPNENHSELAPELFSQLNCSLQRSEKELECSIAAVYVVSDSSFYQQCSSALVYPVHSLDFEEFVHNRTDEDVRIDNLTWAIGLLSLEILGAKKGAGELVDFRQGIFSYNPAWRNLWNAIQTELVSLGLALSAAILWFVSIVYSSQHELTQAEDAIKNLLSSALPEVSVPYRREASFLEEETVRIEEQLRGMGSLSSLSPLESLNVLSKSIGRDIDISVDAVNIAQSRLSLRGSVLDNPSVGRLSGALEKQSSRFCAVKVDPKGRVPGSSRVKFSAEIELCE